MRFPLFLLAFILPVACVAQTEPAAAVVSPVETCSGGYRCDGTTINAEHHGSGCAFGELWLGADGYAIRLSKPAPDGSGAKWGTWTGSNQSFEVCLGGDCTRCELVRPPPSSTSGSGGACTGSPSPCSSRSPGSCSSIEGCYMTSHLKWNGTWENECTGNPYSCSQLTGEKPCLEQGCEWE